MKFPIILDGVAEFWSISPRVDLEKLQAWYLLVETLRENWSFGNGLAHYAL